MSTKEELEEARSNMLYCELEADRLQAERGFEDWFCQSLFDEGLMRGEDERGKAQDG